MRDLAVFLSLAAGVPLLWACRINRRAALLHALEWAAGAWLAWVASAIQDTVPLRYLALVLTACAGVAVLGARRPGAAAWHAVVAGLLIVLLLPLAQGFLAGTDLAIDPLRTIFLGAALGVGLLNYLPTRLGLGAAALLAACLLEIRWLGGDPPAGERAVALLLAAASPWLAWAGRLAWRGGDEADRLWRDFRDRFGVVWGQRLREQFNSAAGHATLDVRLRWVGLGRSDGAPLTDDDRARSLDLLKALMTRFGMP